MKIKQRISIILIFTLCLGLLGCEKKDSNPERKRESLSILSLNTEYKTFQEALQEHCPDVKLDIVSNSTEYSQYLLEKGAIPDIFTISIFGMQEAQQKQLLDLSGYEFLNNYNTADINQVTIDGGVYLVPISASIIGLYYNKTLFAEHGWKLPRSFEELKTLTKTISKEGIDPVAAQFGLPGNVFLNLFTFAKTGFLSTPEGLQWERDLKAGKANASEGLSASAQMIQELIDCGFLDIEDTKRNSKETEEHFFNREAAMYLNAGTLTRFTQNKDGTGDEYGILPFFGSGEGDTVLILQPQRYIGISNKLTEPGNEQKLADALELMKFLSTKEGQLSFLTRQDNYVMPLKNSIIAESSPFYEVEKVIRQGHTSTLVYAGYEPVIVEVGLKVQDWVAGKCSSKDVLTLMDNLQTDYLSEGIPVLAAASQDFTLEETAQLQAEAFRQAAKTDIGMVSVGAYHDGKENWSGACGRLFAGDLTLDILRAIPPNFYEDPVCILTLTGGDIKALLEAGFLAVEGVESFPYVPAGITVNMNEDGSVDKITKADGSPFDETANYTVAIDKGGFTEKIGKKGEVQETELVVVDVVGEYMSANSPLSPLEPSIKKH